MNINELFENVSRLAPLYHATSAENISQILESNTLEGRTAHLSSKGVSLSRSKQFAESFGEVIIVLDQEKLRQRVKLQPTNFFNDDSDVHNHRDREEFEEFANGDGDADGEMNLGVENNKTNRIKIQTMKPTSDVDLLYHYIMLLNYKIVY